MVMTMRLSREAAGRNQQLSSPEKDRRLRMRLIRAEESTHHHPGQGGYPC
jgi:hypothetical protein